MAVITTQSAFPVNVYADKDIRVTATSADQVSTIRALFTLCRRNLTTEFSLRKHIKCFLSKLGRRKIPSGKFRQENHVVIVTTSFMKSSVFQKRFFVYKKTKCRCFQIIPVSRAFSKSSVFVTDWCARRAQP